MLQLVPTSSLVKSFFMSTTTKYNSETFISFKWNLNLDSDEKYDYVPLMCALLTIAQERRESHDYELACIFELLGKVTSFILISEDVHQPLKPFFYTNCNQYSVTESFTDEELSFLQEIIDYIEPSLLKARLADLLWICKKPQNFTFANTAIEAYLQIPIEECSWSGEPKNYWERAGRLCKQINNQNKLKQIESALMTAFDCNYSSESFIPLDITVLLDKLEIDEPYRTKIAEKLFEHGCLLQNSRSFINAIPFFEHASKKFRQIHNREAYINSLVKIAKSYECMATSNESESSLIANIFYIKALKAYRRISNNDRAEFNIDIRINEIERKITETSQKLINDLHLFKTDSLPVNDLVNNAISFVSGANTAKEALYRFTSLYKGFDKSIVNSVPLPAPYNNSDPQKKQILNSIVTSISTVILKPALERIQTKHEITLELLEEICDLSPIVPPKRKKSLSNALLQGFKYNFGAAVHLLCPQLEHLIRIKLKKEGISTTTFDSEGQGEENGLSSLMRLEETQHILGENLTFEIKSIFSERIGFNLRNRVAHGLIDDDDSNSNVCFYAWWMILRMIISSINVTEQD